MKEKEASEEVVQDLFFNIWEKREALDIKSSVKSYLFQSVKNRCLSLIKHVSVREEYKRFNQDSIQYQEKQEEELAGELASLIAVAIKELPEERQKIFRLSRYEGLKYKEIADQLGISIKTVEAQMSKALSYLRKELIDYLPLIIVYLQFIKNNFK